jgi:hypothetical protein
MEDLAQAAFDAANAFGQHLVERNFEAAHAMLSNALKASQSPAELARTVDLMLGNQPARQAAHAPELMRRHCESGRKWW